MPRFPGPATAWMYEVGCPKCRASIKEPCISTSGGKAGGPHSDRRKAALDAGFTPPPDLGLVVHLADDGRVREIKQRVLKQAVSEAAVLEMANMLWFARRVTGLSEQQFMLGVARILVELGFKP